MVSRQLDNYTLVDISNRVHQTKLLGIIIVIFLGDFYISFKNLKLLTVV